MPTAALPALVEPITDEEVRAFRRELETAAPLLCEAEGREEPDRCHREATSRAVLSCGCGWLSCRPCRDEAMDAINAAPAMGGIIVLKCVHHRRAVSIRWVEL
ncbi:MAG: hypothetical protein M3Y29_06405 [Chloroflexota bacterium]|nr:hypothetical protein [Chloroflexota bacterium]